MNACIIAGLEDAKDAKLPAQTQAALALKQTGKWILISMHTVYPYLNLYLNLKFAVNCGYNDDVCVYVNIAPPNKAGLSIWYCNYYRKS